MSERATDLAWLIQAVRMRASGSFVVKVAGAGIGLLVHLVIAHSLGVGEYGNYALMLSWISVLAVVAQFGQDNGVLHFLPTYAVRERWGLIRGLRRGSGLLVLGFSLLISAGGLAYLHWSSSHRSIALNRTFDIGLLLLPVLAQLQQNGALHRALKHAAESDLYVLIVRPAALLLLVVGVGLLSPALMTAPFVAALSLASTVIALVWSAQRVQTHWPFRARVEQPAYEMRAWIRAGAQLSVLSVMMATSTTMGALVVGTFLGAERVGPYYAAVQIAGFGSFGLNAINTILAPMIAEYYAAGHHELLAHLMRRAARMTFAATSVLVVVLAVFGRTLLALFGHGFTIAYVPLLILLFGEWLTTCAGSVGFVLTMTRFQKQAPLIFLCGIATSLLLAVSLVPRWGLDGMALSTVAGWAIWNIIGLIYVHKKLRLNPTIFQSRRIR